MKFIASLALFVALSQASSRQQPRFGAVSSTKVYRGPNRTYASTQKRAVWAQVEPSEQPVEEKSKVVKTEDEQKLEKKAKKVQKKLEKKEKKDKLKKEKSGEIKQKVDEVKGKVETKEKINEAKGKVETKQKVEDVKAKKLIQIQLEQVAEDEEIELDDEEAEFDDEVDIDDEDYEMEDIDSELDLGTDWEEAIMLIEAGQPEPEIDWSMVFKKGFCPEYEGKTDLEAAKLSGDWYMHKSSDYKYTQMPSSCAHITTSVSADGEFIAKEELKILDKLWVADMITGQVTPDTVSVNMFDENLSMKMQVLDTDYDNYLISVRCFDNMSFAFEENLEPVHILAVAIYTHEPEVDQALITECETKVTEKMPEFNLEQFSSIAQGTEGKCEYQTFDLTEKPVVEETTATEGQ